MDILKTTLRGLKYILLIVAIQALIVAVLIGPGYLCSEVNGWFGLLYVPHFLAICYFFGELWEAP
jgi:hypothetical protein